MGLNALNQNFRYNLSSFLTDMLNSNAKNKNNNSGNYYAKKGEPTYQKDMDGDDDGIITIDEFRKYCKEHGISAKEMVKMMEQRLNYQMSKGNNAEKEQYDSAIGNLEIIYAKDGDDKYDKNMDTNSDAKISYKEYLRYCEQNAKTEDKNSDTRIRENNKDQFMTVSYGKITKAYSKVESEAPEGKVEGRA